MLQHTVLIPHYITNYRPPVNSCEFEVFTVVQLRIVLLWNMMLCHWVVGTYFSRQIRALIVRG